MSLSGQRQRGGQSFWQPLGSQLGRRWISGLRTLVWGILTVLVAEAYADPAGTISPLPASGSGATFLALIRVLGALALVFAAFFGGLWLWRNWQRVLLRKGRSSKLAIIEGKSLGPRHTLYVIGYEQQRMLVAASPSGVTMLTALPEAEPVSDVSAVPAGTVPTPGFGALLLRAIAQRS